MCGFQIKDPRAYIPGLQRQNPTEIPLIDKILRALPYVEGFRVVLT